MIKSCTIKISLLLGLAQKKLNRVRFCLEYSFWQSGNKCNRNEKTLLFKFCLPEILSNFEPNITFAALCAFTAKIIANR